MQVYNLAIDDKSKQNAATIQYQIMDMASNKSILDTSETSAALGDNSVNSDQLTVRRSVPLASLQPGKYQVTITVNDHVSKQQVAQSAHLPLTPTITHYPTHNNKKKTQPKQTKNQKKKPPSKLQYNNTFYTLNNTTHSNTLRTQKHHNKPKKLYSNQSHYTN